MTETELTTVDDYKKYSFFQNSSGLFEFKVRAAHDAHVSLTTTAELRDPMYQVLFGCYSNTIAIIRKNMKTDIKKIEVEGILNGDRFRGLWVRWKDRVISAGREGEGYPFITVTDSESVPIKYVGVSTGWGSIGRWIITEQPREKPIEEPTEPLGMRWVKAENGTAPPDAYAGGDEQGQTMFVIRAHHRGSLIPGKLVRGSGTSFIGLGGSEISCASYEVLCGFEGRWEQCSGDDIPSNAFEAGQTYDGEPLYIGRVTHRGSLTVGKVQASHGVCYIPYGGKEISFTEYEILVL